MVQSFSLGLFVYFLFHLVSGEKGYFALQAARMDLAQRQQNLEKLHADRVVLEKRVTLMRPESIDRDMLDEQARTVLGYTENNEQVILLTDSR